jgi:hypothetical protein
MRWKHKAAGVEGSQDSSEDEAAMVVEVGKDEAEVRRASPLSPPRQQPSTPTTETVRKVRRSRSKAITTSSWVLPTAPVAAEEVAEVVAEVDVVGAVQDKPHDSATRD